MMNRVYKMGIIRKFKERTLTQRLIRYGLLLLLPLLAACNLTTGAQQNVTLAPNSTPNTTSGDWSAYVYNSRAGELVRVLADGTQTSYTLGLANDSYMSSYDMSISDDGTRAAFCQTIYQPESPISTAKLLVRDIAAQTNIIDLDLGSSEGKTCSMGRRALVGNLLAVAVMNYTPFAQNPDTSQPQWQVMIIDATTGETVKEINANENPVTADERFDPERMTLPVIIRFTGTEVFFTFVPYGSDGFYETPAFVWHLDDDSIDAIDYWGRMGFDISASGEMIYPDNDPNLPVGTPMGPTASFNVLRLVDGGEPRTIYHVPDWLIANSRFINHGQQIAVMMFPSFDPEASEGTPQGAIRWISIDRAGNVTELFETPYYAEVMPAPNGYVVLKQEYENGDFQRGSFTLEYVANGSSNVLWRSGETGDANWELVWSAPTTMAEGLAAFPTFTP
jgi:hypothetical protein